MSSGDIGGVPLSRDIGALQSAAAVATINPEFIPRGLGPSADIAHLILRGMNVNPVVGGGLIGRLAGIGGTATGSLAGNGGLAG